MNFSWDERKRQEKWKIRIVDFAEAVGIFDDPKIIEAADDRVAYGEERIRALGQTGCGFYLIAYTWRAEIRHIITAWKVGQNGKRRFEALFAKRHRGYEGKG